MKSDTVLKEACKLPLAEQIELCCSLSDNIAGSTELTPDEAELIDRRLREHLANPADVISFEALKSRLNVKYGQ
jgi:putative addiction module component (TIGR02574 family)